MMLLGDQKIPSQGEPMLVFYCIPLEEDGALRTRYTIKIPSENCVPSRYIVILIPAAGHPDKFLLLSFGEVGTSVSHNAGTIYKINVIFVLL